MQNNEDVNWSKDTTERFLQTSRQVDKLETEVAIHEVQCEERWKTNFQRLENIDAQLARIESRMVTLGGTVILFLAGVIITLVTTVGAS